MAAQPAFAREEYIGNFFAAIKSLNAFDHAEIHDTVSGRVTPTLRESYVTMNYHRAEINIELLLTLTDTRQFQAIAMLARSIFELAVEIRLMSVMPDAAEKIHLFMDVEKLRSARKILEFEKLHGAKLPSAYREFIDKNAQRIDVAQSQMWPGKKRVDHWSLMDLASRTKKLGAPFDEIYQTNYPQLSWYVHSGVTGVANGGGQLFADLAGVAYVITFHSYVQMLDAVADEFRLHKTDATLRAKMSYAKFVAFTKSEQEATQLRRACMEDQ